MIKPLIALTCCLAALAVAGCGGGSSSSADRAQICATAHRVYDEYIHALGAMGLKLTHKPLVEATVAKIGPFRAQLQHLRGTVGASEARQLDALSTGLQEQAVVITQISKGETAAAAKSGNKVNEAILVGLPNFRRICGIKGIL
jgi:hypothetical protein